MFMAWEPNRIFNFFSPPVYLCAATNITEIFLTVTLNTYSVLSDTVSSTTTDISFTDPRATSSPKRQHRGNSTSRIRKDLPLRTVIINCQSIVGKKAHLNNLITASQADIVIGTESWLDPRISSAEIFPSGFKVFRKDRASGTKGGGVFI